ncbi:hypothetical protein NVP1121O_127 [Vibrio phage 1.121.O._10N.286.46.C4]|nr:hypothetical protein NVP1121O_127 [Vibrio phage 1.121.O._10N.286.46.C4]
MVALQGKVSNKYLTVKIGNFLEYQGSKLNSDFNLGLWLDSAKAMIKASEVLREDLPIYYGEIETVSFRTLISNEVNVMPASKQTAIK